MFGLLYSLFVGSLHGVKCIQDSVENNERKNKYYDSDTDIYFDNKMTMRDIYSNRIVSYERDRKTNDLWIIDANNRQRIRKISCNFIFDKHYKEEKRKYDEGKTAKTYIRYGDNDYRDDDCRGGRVKDLKTGKLYVVRKIKKYDEINRTSYPIGVTCLMDIETGEFIRPIDSCLLFSLDDEDKRKLQYEIIKKENEKKKIMVDEWYKKKDDNPSNYDIYIMYKYSNHMKDNNYCELIDKDNNFLIERGKRLI